MKIKQNKLKSKLKTGLKNARMNQYQVYKFLKQHNKH